MSKFEVPSGYIAVRTSTLVPDISLGVSIYLPIDGRAVRYGKSGEVFDKARFNRLLEFKKKKVLIQESDEPEYRKYLEQALENTMADEKVAIAEKTQLAASAAESAAEDIIKKPQEKAAYEKAQLYFKNFGDLLKKHGGSFAEVLNAPYDPDQDHVGHGLQVAALSVFMCDLMGLIKNEAHQTSIITGCFMHDIGLDKPEAQRKGLDKNSQIWKEHPQEGIRILQGLDHIDQQVIKIILEHEELPNGDGFPNKLTQKTMDPVSVVVSLANRFQDYVEKCAGDKKAALEQVFTGELGHFELPLLEQLRTALKKNLL